MKIEALAGALNLKILTPLTAEQGQLDIEQAYASDLLSDVLAHAPQQGLLITIQTHINVVAVALHAEMACVLFAMGREPEASVCEKAAEEGICLLASEQSAFELAGQLFQLGIRGR